MFGIPILGPVDEVISTMFNFKKGHSQLARKYPNPLGTLKKFKLKSNRELNKEK